MLFPKLDLVRILLRQKSPGTSSVMFVLTRLSTEEAIIQIKVSVLLDGSAAVEVRSDRFMQPMLGRMLRNGAMGEGNVQSNLSIVNTFGTRIFVHYSEVFINQRLHWNSIKFKFIKPMI